MAGFNKTFEELMDPDGEFLSKQHAVKGDGNTVMSCTKPGLHSMHTVLCEMFVKANSKYNSSSSRREHIESIEKLAVECDTDKLKRSFVLKITKNAVFWKSCSEPAKKWLQPYRGADDDSADDEVDDAPEVETVAAEEERAKATAKKATVDKHS
jgi:hypothetical protein